MKDLCKSNYKAYKSTDIVYFEYISSIGFSDS